MHIYLMRDTIVPLDLKNVDEKHVINCDYRKYDSAERQLSNN